MINQHPLRTQLDAIAPKRQPSEFECLSALGELSHRLEIIAKRVEKLTNVANGFFANNQQPNQHNVVALELLTELIAKTALQPTVTSPIDAQIAADLAGQVTAELKPGTPLVPQGNQ